MTASLSPAVGLLTPHPSGCRTRLRAARGRGTTRYYLHTPPQPDAKSGGRLKASVNGSPLPEPRVGLSWSMEARHSGVEIACSRCCSAPNKGVSSLQRSFLPTPPLGDPDGNRHGLSRRHREQRLQESAARRRAQGSTTGKIMESRPEGRDFRL